MNVNLSIDPNIDLMNKVFEAEQDTTPRTYLGMSSIGMECERNLWYTYRHANTVTFSAKTLYKFEDGHYSEALTAKRLKKVNGIDLKDVNEDGEQFGFVDIGGHFRGHADGIISGLYQAVEKPHIWEHKCVDEKKFNKFEKLTQELPRNDVLKAWDGIYYAQAQMYMHYSGIDRHWLTVAYAGSRNYAAVRTDYRKKDAVTLQLKAQDIIASDIPPVKISEKPDYFQCKWCDHHNICHGESTAKANCRTCLYSFPDIATEGGKWYCQRFEQYLENEFMDNNQCIEHLYIPNILENVADFIGADSASKTVTYRNKVNQQVFVNGSHLDTYLSKEIERNDIAVIGDVIIDDIKATFETRLHGGN